MKLLRFIVVTRKIDNFCSILFDVHRPPIGPVLSAGRCGQKCPSDACSVLAAGLPLRAHDQLIAIDLVASRAGIAWARGRFDA